MTFGKFSVLRQVIQDRDKEVEPLGKNLELLTLAEYKYHSKKGDPVYILSPPPFFKYFEPKTQNAHLHLWEKLLFKKHD